MRTPRLFSSSARTYIRNGNEKPLHSRISPLDIQMISKVLHRHIFGEEPSMCDEDVKASKDHLKQHGLWGKQRTLIPDVEINLPPLQGSNIYDHFTNIAHKQLVKYCVFIQQLLNCGLPQMPSSWVYEPGWTKYEFGRPISIPYPDEDVMILDVEVCLQEGHTPVLATLSSPTHWYSWVSERLLNEQEYVDRSKVMINELIPLGMRGGSERLVVGHHVSYDRARIKEQYDIKGSKMKFLDTLSLHVCVAGQTTTQKHIWLKKYGKKFEKNISKGEEEMEDRSHMLDFRRGRKSSWMTVSSPNALDNVYKLYCGNDIDKSARDVFVKGSISDIRNQFQSLMTYCAEDVRHTHEILKVLYPIFIKRCPHSVTLAGLMEMGSTYLPVNYSWIKYLQSAKYTAEDMENEMTNKLMEIADDTCYYYMFNNRFKSDIWLTNLNWSYKNLRKKGRSLKYMKQLIDKLQNEKYEREEKFKRANIQEKFDEVKYLISSLTPSKELVHLPGYPEWYRNLFQRRDRLPWKPGPVHLSSQMRIVPYILRMKWKGNPLHYHKQLGWGYLISVHGQSAQDNSSSSIDVLDDVTQLINNIEDSTLLTSENVGRLRDETKLPVNEIDALYGKCNDIININEDSYYFFKIPHKNGPDVNCGNPLSNDYLSKMEDGTLTSAAGDEGQRILLLNTMISFWRGAKTRIENQFVLWRESGGNKDTSDSFHFTGEDEGVILPQVMVAGTATRRAVERTWLTASNAKESRVGSELKGMVQAPLGYHLVGADVDSQELWIASILGDKHFAGLHGCTAFSWMNLQGNKSEGTDLHSKTAETIGISRDHAKVFNYGRMYGAGRSFAELLLKQFNPSLTELEIKEKALSLYNTTKGRRRIILSKRGQENAEKIGLKVWKDGSIDQSDWSDKFKDVKVRMMTRGRYWYGGTESYMFNKLESIARSENPSTPVLGCMISQALEPKNVGTDFMTSRINWIVQSSAVDYLHLLLVSMRWLMDTYHINGRLCISIHDEIRYLVESHDRYRAALALQISNLFTRAMFAHQLGMNDLPLGVAFFSAVDIDKVLRKEVTMDCKTPSNPQGLKEGLGIDYGEALDIFDILEKTSENLKSERNNNKDYKLYEN